MKIQTVLAESEPDTRGPIHPFTKSGLGPAPFKFLYVCSIPSPHLAEQNPTAYNNALRDLPRNLANGCGSCAHCGMPIMNIYVIRNAEGTNYGVGCVCINKTEDRALVKDTNAARLDMLRKRRQQSRAARDEERLRTNAKLATVPVGRYSGLTAEELIERDPEYTKWLVGGGIYLDRYPAFKAAIEATDFVRNIRRAETEALEARARIGSDLSDLAERLRDGRGGFRDSVADSISNGRWLSRNQVQIASEILAKQRGRSGSKAFGAEYELVYERLEALMS